jgi:hypothetical protein
MLKKFVIVVLVIVGLFVGLGLALGSDFRVERRAVIKADAARVHEHCGELKNWPAWSPWIEADPTIVTTFGDKTTGVGAHQSWTGADGNGELTFTKCDPTSGTAYDMVFIDGERRSPSVCVMNYKPVDGGTEVIWVIEGKLDMPVIGPYLALAFDGMVGPSFERGLEKLAALCEKG